jgi:two-component system, sensor histidine kinase and response regulator
MILLSWIFGWSLVTTAQSPDSAQISAEMDRAYDIFLNDPDVCIGRTARAIEAANRKQITYLQGKGAFILSKAYWAKGNLRLSLQHGNRAKNIFLQLSRRKELALAQLSLARTFIDLQNFDEATALLNEARSIAMVERDEKITGEVYRELSMYFSVMKMRDSALLYIDKGLRIYERHSDMLNTSILYGRKARILYNQGSYSESLGLTLRSIVMDSLVGNSRALGISYYLAGQNLYKLQKTDSAARLLTKAIPYSERVSNYSVLINVHDLLAEIDLKKNNLAEAVSHLKQVSQLKDSVYNTQKNAQLQATESLYEIESKEETISSLERENALQHMEVKNQRMIMTLLVIGIILLVALILVLLRVRTLQARATKILSEKNGAIEQQKEEIEAQAENLQRLNDLKTKLFSVISHDLRGPIATLHALLELLTNQQMTPEEFMALSHKVKGNINVTQRTLENLLNWSLSQMEGLKTERRNVSIGPLLEDSCKLLEELADRKAVSLICDADPRCIVICDPDQVQLILRNLIHNAIKFSKQHGTVLITALATATECRVTVKDFGIGMTGSELETVQGSTHHFTKDGTLQEKGTGLGLLLCQEFIKRNEGKFSIISKQGEGTEVSFSLPLASPQKD